MKTASCLSQRLKVDRVLFCCVSACGWVAHAEPVPPAPQDYCSKPFRRVVVLGESTVEGGGWIEKKQDRYADVLVRCIDSVQAQPVEYFNKGIGGNAISPRSPGYPKSIKPSALERYHEDVIGNRPDLLVLAYGLNDMRAGMKVHDFISDLERIVRDVKAACNPVIVLVSVYHMPRYDWHAPFNKGSAVATVVYNREIQSLAERTGCLYADVYSAEGRADWVVHYDTVHANKVGNLLIGHKIFEVLANHCSGLSQAIHERDETTEWTKAIRANH